MYPPLEKRERAKSVVLIGGWRVMDAKKKEANEPSDSAHNDGIGIIPLLGFRSPFHGLAQLIRQHARSLFTQCTRLDNALAAAAVAGFVAQ